MSQKNKEFFEERDLNIFKEILIEFKDSYKTWKIINREFNRRAGTNHKDDWTGTRYDMAKLLREDGDFLQEHGMLITKNPIGAKVTKVPEEVKQMITGEEVRASSIYKKLQPIKTYYASITSKDNFEPTTKCIVFNPQIGEIDITNTGLTQEELKQNGDFFKEQINIITAKYPNIQSKQLAIEIIREAAFNTVDHIKGGGKDE